MHSEAAHEKDDTMDHRTLAALLGAGKNRIRRVMHTYGITARRKREARMSTEASQPKLCQSQLREEAFEWVGNEVVFSDILEVKRADGTRVRGCFALRHRTRQVLLIAFDYHMRADLVTDAIETMAFEVPGSIWHSEEAQTLWGGPDPLLALAQRRMSLSMSQAGTPTDNGMRNACQRLQAGWSFTSPLVYAEGDILRAAQAWINLYNQERPARGARYPLSASLCEAA